jgi:sterol desaturase/sphingolipid hydroxylase (fatty acid hydroxylase superfamily)
MTWLQDLNLTGLSRDVLRTCAWLVIVVLIFVPLERLFAVRPTKFVRPALGGDIAFFFINSLIPPLLLLTPLALAAWAGYRFAPEGMHQWIDTLPLWTRVVAAFVIADLGFYWGHRLAHRIPLLWRFHAVHHAPEHIYFLISARAHPIDNAFIRLCGFVPIFILGLGAPRSVQGTLVATLIMLVLTLWGFFIHANMRWRFGPLERLMATPAFHHRHHVRDDRTGHNFASMLPIWDMVFGTHLGPKHPWPEAYGLTAPLRPTVTGQLVEPFLPEPTPVPVEVPTQS